MNNIEGHPITPASFGQLFSIDPIRKNTSFILLKGNL